MSIRSTYFFGTLVAFSLLLISIYFQLFEGFVPCPLCALQRITFALLGLLFFIGIFIYKKRYGSLFLNLFAFITSILGVLLAGRQIWLQHFPPSHNNECGVSLQYMLHVLPMHTVAQKIVEGSAECTQRGWEFLSLNMAEWSLLWFIFFCILSLYLLLKKRSIDIK